MNAFQWLFTCPILEPLAEEDEARCIVLLLYVTMYINVQFHFILLGKFVEHLCLEWKYANMCQQDAMLPLVWKKHFLMKSVNCF